MDQVRGSQTTFLHSEKGKSEKQKSTTKGQSIANGHLQSSSKRLSNFFCLVSVRSEKRKRGIFGCFSTYACFRERERERKRKREREKGLEARGALGKRESVLKVDLLGQHFFRVLPFIIIVVVVIAEEENSCWTVSRVKIASRESLRARRETSLPYDVTSFWNVVGLRQKMCKIAVFKMWFVFVVSSTIFSCLGVPSLGPIQAQAFPHTVNRLPDIYWNTSNPM